MTTGILETYELQGLTLIHRENQHPRPIGMMKIAKEDGEEVPFIAHYPLANHQQELTHPNHYWHRCCVPWLATQPDKLAEYVAKNPTGSLCFVPPGISEDFETEDLYHEALCQALAAINCKPTLVFEDLYLVGDSASLACRYGTFESFVQAIESLLRETSAHRPRFELREELLAYLRANYEFDLYTATVNLVIARRTGAICGSDFQFVRGLINGDDWRVLLATYVVSI